MDINKELHTLGLSLKSAKWYIEKGRIDLATESLDKAIEAKNAIRVIDNTRTEELKEAIKILCGVEGGDR